MGERTTETLQMKELAKILEEFQRVSRIFEILRKSWRALKNSKKVSVGQMKSWRILKKCESVSESLNKAWQESSFEVFYSRKQWLQKATSDYNSKDKKERTITDVV